MQFDRIYYIFNRIILNIFYVNIENNDSKVICLYYLNQNLNENKHKYVIILCINI